MFQSLKVLKLVISDYKNVKISQERGREGGGPGGARGGAEKYQKIANYYWNGP